MKKQIILGVKITNRATHAHEVQDILTEYGCNIKTRLGLHDVDENVCSTSGILLLEMYGDETKILEAEKKMQAVDGVEVRKMEFDL